MKCNKCGYDYSNSGDSAHVCNNNLIPIDDFCKKSAKQINEQYKARQAFWNVALGNNSKLANLAKLAIDEVEKLGLDEVDIRSRLYQRIHELETQLAQRTWVGLTDREKSNLWLESRAAIPRFYTYATIVEAKLKEKNNA